MKAVSKIAVGLVAFTLLILLFTLPKFSKGSEETLAGTTQISSCTIISSSGEYVLTQNLVVDTATESACLKIVGNDIIIDGMGYKIEDSSSPLAVEVVDSNNVTLMNFTVKNITLINKDNAIVVNNSNSVIIKNLTISEITSLEAILGIFNSENIKVENINMVGTKFAVDSVNGLIILNNVSEFEINDNYFNVTQQNTTSFLALTFYGINLINKVYNGSIRDNTISLTNYDTADRPLIIPSFFRGESSNITFKNNFVFLNSSFSSRPIVFSGFPALKSNYTVFNNTMVAYSKVEAINQLILNNIYTIVSNNTFYMNGEQINAQLSGCNYINTNNNIVANNTFYYSSAPDNYMEIISGTDSCFVENIIQYNNTFNIPHSYFIYDFVTSPFINYMFMDSDTNMPYIVVTLSYTSIYLGSALPSQTLTAVNFFSLQSNLIDTSIVSDATDFVGTTSSFSKTYLSIFNNYTSEFNDAFYPTFLPNIGQIHFKNFARDIYQKYKLTVPDVLADTYRSTVTLTFSSGLSSVDYLINDNGEVPPGIEPL